VDETHTCPRRAEAPGRWRGDDGVDRREDRGSLVGGIGPSCSYCGSLSPEKFMELVEQGWWVDPTDKSYKAYLAEPLTDAEVAAARDRWMATDFVARVRSAACADHAGNVDAVVEHEWQQMPAAQGHGQVRAKFYYQHLSSEQMDRFIEIVNAKQMKIGTPGYFYVLPYFCSPSRPGE
jgi:hypothetical protein